MRSHGDSKLGVLADVPLFSGFSRAHLERVSQLCTRIEVEAGSVLCRQGATGSEFFVIIEGTARVSVNGRDVNTLGPGDFFGELALLDGGPRVATVTSETPMSALVLSRSEFAQLLRDEPQVAVNLLPAVGERLRAARGAPQ